MFQNTIIEIIKRVENLTQNKRSIIELDIKDIKEKIQETLFNIDFTVDTIEDEDLVNIDELKCLDVSVIFFFFGILIFLLLSSPYKISNP